MLVAEFVALVDEGRMFTLDIAGERAWIEDVSEILMRIAGAVGALAVLGNMHDMYEMTALFTRVDTLGDTHEMCIDIAFEDEEWINSLYIVLFKICFAYGVDVYPTTAVEVEV